jgi:hypothetical protein
VLLQKWLGTPMIFHPVELWDDKDSHIEEVIALASDYATARSAFDEAVKRRPGKLITLRQKARVIQRSR